MQPPRKVGYVAALFVGRFTLSGCNSNKPTSSAFPRQSVDYSRPVGHFISLRTAKEQEGTKKMVDNVDEQQALLVYVQTCHKELFQDDNETTREGEQERLVSQSEFADFVWEYCRTNRQFAGSACTNDNATMVDEDETQPSSSSSSSSFDALPLQAKLAFLPKVDNDSSAGCSKDAPLLDQLNCLLVDNSISNNPSETEKEQDDGQEEIYLKTSERIDVLCSNATYALLLESNLLQSPQPMVSPSTDAPTQQSSMRPGSASSSSLLHQQHSALSADAIAGIVLTALFLPILLLAIYCWRRKKQRHNESNNNLLHLFTKITAPTFDDEPRDDDHHHKHDVENPALVEDQSVSSENSRAFSPFSATESNNTDGTEEREKSPIASWILNLSPRNSEATQRSFRQPQRTNNSKKKPTATAAPDISVRSHGNGSTGSSRRSRGSNSLHKKSKRLSSTFAYPTELQESVVSPGNSSWFQTSSGVPPGCITEHISHDNPVLQRKRFNHNNTKARPAFSFDKEHEQSTANDTEVVMPSNRNAIHGEVDAKHDKKRNRDPPTILDAAARSTSTKPKSRYSPTTTSAE